MDELQGIIIPNTTDTGTSTWYYSTRYVIPDPPDGTSTSKTFYAGAALASEASKYRKYRGIGKTFYVYRYRKMDRHITY